MTSRGLLNVLVSPLLDFVYPPACISCRAPLPDGSQKVCGRCWDSIARLSQGHPLYLETKRKLVAAGNVSGLVSAFVFEKEGAFQHIAHALKYSGYESIGHELGTRLGRTMIEWGVHADVLIPIPLHRVKRRERGYNQAEQIARGVASVTGMRVLPSAVTRTKHTQTQTQLSSEARKKNMEEAFGVNTSQKQAFYRKSCILIDDVITTGATIDSCARVLVSGGASDVIAASVALAQ